YAEIVAEFVRLNVDVILTHGTPATVRAQQTTPVIPIVFTVVGDPIGTGLVASLSRPGGNLTGQSIMVSDLAAKRLELLQEVVPKLHRGNPWERRQSLDRARNGRGSGDNP